MSLKAAERYLPANILRRASLRGKEYAWTVHDIPHVIEAARRAGLVNIGGQLQFRFPDGGTCECYWVGVDTHLSVPKDLPWQERVDRTAAAAADAFSRLPSEFDFVAEGRRGFAQHIQEFEQQGHDVREALCFVWYVLDEADEAAAQQPGGSR
jgi:hypothetical protein